MADSSGHMPLPKLEIPIRNRQAIMDVAVLPQGFVYDNLSQNGRSNESKIPEEYRCGFLIDSGAMASCLSEHVVRRNRFPLVGETAIRNTHGLVESSYCSVDLYLFGIGQGFPIDKMPMIDLGEDRSYQGVLGMDILMLGELNFKNGICTFSL